MLREFTTLAKTPVIDLQSNERIANFSKQQSDVFFESISNKKPDAKISEGLEEKIIPFYHQLAVENAMDDPIELKYISK